MTSLQRHAHPKVCNIVTEFLRQAFTVESRRAAQIVDVRNNHRRAFLTGPDGIRIHWLPSLVWDSVGNRHLVHAFLSDANGTRRDLGILLPGIPGMARNQRGPAW